MPEIIRDLPKQTIAIVPAGAGIGFGGLSVKEQYGPSLRILFFICALVLVIACANVANLLLARSVRRRGQTAVRLAIGATRSRIVAEALTESVVLGVAGGLAGLLIAYGAARLLVALAFRSSQSVPIATTPSPVVLAFAAGLSLVTGIVFGGAPAWFATHTDPIDALRGLNRGGRLGPSGARTALLIVQAMLSVVLIACSTMLARSLANLEHQDFGYRLRGRVLIGLNRLPPTYTPQQLSILYRNVEQRLGELPGMLGAGLAAYNPLTGTLRNAIVVAGHPPDPVNESLALWDRVSADYLQGLGITLVRGRFFTLADDETAAPVATVNEAFVKRFFKNNEDPLDQHFGVEQIENAGTFRIVGVVNDAKFRLSELREPADPMFFVPLAQGVDYKTNSARIARRQLLVASGRFNCRRARMLERLSHFVQGMGLVTDSMPGHVEPILRRTLTEVDPNLTITTVRTMQEQIEFVFDRERAVTILGAIFGVVALALAGIGVYGVTAYTVAQQTNEIGIRVALGANRANVIGLVLWGALQRVGAGIVVGVPGAVGAAKFMAAQLYGVPFWDPFSLAIATGALVGCTFFAAIIPAGAAAATSPMDALRAG